MHRLPKPSWWGLYLLAPVTAAVLFLSARLSTRGVVYTLLVIAAIALLGVLAFCWSEANADLVGSDGVDALAEKSALSFAGVDAGRYAPSLTRQQAHYRAAMFHGDPGQDEPGR